MDNLTLTNNLLNSFKAFLGSHFMFNVVNTIQSDLLLSKTKDAFQTLQIFNRLYKYGVRCSNQQYTTLAEEIGFLNQYLAMEHIRFEQRKFPKTLSCEAIVNDTLVPTFILQSFIENAVLLSFEQKQDAGFNILLRQKENQIDLVIQLQVPKNVQYHSKTESKVQLAESRLALLTQEKQFSYTLNWHEDTFMYLSFNFTEN